MKMLRMSARHRGLVLEAKWKGAGRDVEMEDEMQAMVVFWRSYWIS